jgi:hypothetical protein
MKQNNHVSIAILLLVFAFERIRKKEQVEFMNPFMGGFQNSIMIIDSRLGDSRRERN